MLIPDQGGLVTGTKLTNKYVKYASLNMLVIKTGQLLFVLCYAHLVLVICYEMFNRSGPVMAADCFFNVNLLYLEVS